GYNTCVCPLTRQRLSLDDLLPPGSPADARDLLKKLLIFNPDKRLTAEEALQHPYVKRFHSPARETALDYDVILPVDDDIQLSVAEYRNKLYEMILERKMNIRRQKREAQKESVSSVPKHDTDPPARHPETSTDPPVTRTPARQPETSTDPPVTRTPARQPETSSHTGPHVNSTTATGVLTHGAPTGQLAEQTPQSRAPSYNPITHGVPQGGSGDGRGVQNSLGPPQNRKPGRQNGQEQAAPAQRITAQEARKGWEPRGRSAPITRARSFSLAQQARAAAPNNALTRKDAASTGAVSVAAVSARLNQRTPLPQPRDPRSAQKFSKKMFQGTANVGAAGDPKASLQSYTQAYGTITKSALQSLPLHSSTHGGN
ncbi:mitogen-activated protein kinase 15-like, partial [Ascaphus truei]|uniref:mitogen-activated protein kinase 15-like n=1 Tax=Ascaphus truei TaxID=8439 RepID=UPI003F5A01A9